MGEEHSLHPAGDGGLIRLSRLLSSFCAAPGPAVFFRPKEQYREQPASREAAGYASVFRKPDGRHRAQPPNEKQRQVSIEGPAEKSWEIGFQVVDTRGTPHPSEAM